MILSTEMIENLIEEDSSKINLNIDSTNQPQWTNYVEQYRLIIYLLSQNNNGINNISYPFLFLVRHFTELLLKENLVNEGVMLVYKHDFKSILQRYTECNLSIPSELKDAITSTYSLDNDGSCYRYFNEISFDSQPIQLSEFFERFQKIENSSFFYRKLTNYKEYNRKTKGLFSCYIYEISAAGQLRTQYDTAIERILTLIASGSVDIYDIYLPLMFLLRHSLELALKTSLEGVFSLENNKKKLLKINSMLSKEHSIARLFNKFALYLTEERINSISDIKFKASLIESKNKVFSYQETIHQLDNTSRQFRYIPEESKTIKINNSQFKKILELYLDTDSFLTFGVDTLKLEGIIPLSDKELDELFR